MTLFPRAVPLQFQPLVSELFFCNNSIHIEKLTKHLIFYLAVVATISSKVIIVFWTKSIKNLNRRKMINIPIFDTVKITMVYRILLLK